MSNFTSIRQTQSLAHRGQKSLNPITKKHFQVMLMAMVLSLVYVTYTTQFSSSVPAREEGSAIIQKTILGIKDDSNGDILIELIADKTRSNNDSEVQTNKVLRFSGEQGFLRGTLRALARDRRLRNLSSEAPFELALYENGRLSITDTLTSRGIDLEAFGPDNVAVFAKILQEFTKDSSLKQSAVSSEHSNIFIPPSKPI